MKRETCKRELWLRKSITIVLVAGVCFSESAEASPTEISEIENGHYIVVDDDPIIADGIDAGYAEAIISSPGIVNVNAEASLNSVFVENGTIGGCGVVGGYAKVDNAAGVSGANISISASNNIITIAGGNITSSVEGGNAKEINVGAGNNISV